MCKSTGTHEVEISWEPPKGDFTKYVLAGKLFDATQSCLKVTVSWISSVTLHVWFNRALSYLHGEITEPLMCLFFVWIKILLMTSRSFLPFWFDYKIKSSSLFKFISFCFKSNDKPLKKRIQCFKGKFASWACNFSFEMSPDEVWKEFFYLHKYILRHESSFMCI